jgi:hypothetical protein
MQAIFAGKEALANALRGTLSEARFARYLSESNGDQLLALSLYHWNAKLSQCLYFPVQIWEIALRNKMNVFLGRKYTNPKWMYDEARAVRQLTKSDQKRLTKVIERQKTDRKLAQPTPDMIVADLSAGFWVSQLTQSYDTPYAWRYNITKVFPHDPSLTRSVASTMCDRVLDVRNRIAHHEPVYHLPLDEIRDDLDQLIAGMCPGANEYAMGMCDFPTVWAARPTAASLAAAMAATAAANEDDDADATLPE